MTRILTALLLTLLAAIGAASPAAAEPRTVVCGPFTPTQPIAGTAPISPVSFRIDAEAKTANLILPDGALDKAEISDPTDNGLSVSFSNSAVMRDMGSYKVVINNASGEATLTRFPALHPFAKGMCRAGGGIAY